MNELLLLFCTGSIDISHIYFECIYETTVANPYLETCMRESKSDTGPKDVSLMLMGLWKFVFRTNEQRCV